MPIEEKNYKKFISEFPAALVSKLRPGIVLNFGGPVSLEFAIFAKFFLPRLPKCITLKSIFVNNLSLASVWNALMHNAAVIVLSLVHYFILNCSSIIKHSQFYSSLEIIRQ